MKPVKTGYAPTKLSERQKEQMRRLALGKRQKDVAAEFGVTPRMVSYVQHSPAGQEYLARLSDGRDASTMDVNKALHELAPAAVATLGDALDGQLGGCAQDHARMKAAESVLDRTGYGRTSKQVVAETKYVGIEHIRRLADEQAENINVKNYLQAREAEFQVVKSKPETAAEIAETDGKQ